MDAASRRWVEDLGPGHPRHDEAVAGLHDALRRVARHELRRRARLAGLSGPEFDDVAQQCANDAMVNILARVGDFRGLSRFTTWAYKFVMFEVSNKVVRHAWRRHAPSDVVWEQLPDVLAPRPGAGRAPRATRRACEGGRGGGCARVWPHPRRAAPRRSTCAPAPAAAPTTTACSTRRGGSATSSPSSLRGKTRRRTVTHPAP